MRRAPAPGAPRAARAERASRWRARTSAANTEDGAVKEKEPEASSGEEEEEEEEEEASAGPGAAAADADVESASAASFPRAKKMSRKQKKKLSKKTAAAQAKARAAAERNASKNANERGDETRDAVADEDGEGSERSDAAPSASDSENRNSEFDSSRDSTSRTKNPKKGVDLLLPVDYLSPALAQKMARNGHLSALSQGVGASDAPAAFPTPETESPSNAAAEADENKKSAISPSVLYALDVISDRGAGRTSRPSFPITHDFEYAKSPTPVFVMLPLDVISRDGALQHRQALEISLRTLKKIGVEGVMTDVWWGIVERDGPEMYDWTAYLELLDLVQRAGLKLNAVMSFHACGANVGDYFKVTLPPWVLEAASADPDLFFTDQYGYRNPECISLWADNAMTLHGRTPLESYRDFMRSFRDAVEREGFGDVLSEVSVGCGPCGELRYPAYPENKISPNSSQWQFPGIGEFQCYDQRALGNLARAGSEAGHIEWGGAGPHDAGGYNNLPHETGFFRAHEGSWDSEYGQFSCRGTRASSWSTATACYSVRDRCSSERTWQSRLTRLLWTERARRRSAFPKKEKKGREKRRRRNARRATRRATRRPIDLPPGRRWRSSVRACTGGTTAGATPRSSPRGTSTRARATAAPSATGTSPS